MKLRQWPTRRIAWLWFAVVLYMGALVAFGALRTREQRASLAKRYGWVPDTATATHLTSAQRAQRDSLLDSLMHIAEQYLNSPDMHRSEEHTSELQSHSDLVCRLLLEKKKKQYKKRTQ